MISEYKFGEISVDDIKYTHDIEVRWTDEVLLWPRKESHIIDVEDVSRAISQGPETIVIGNGNSGLAEVTEDAQIEIKRHGIDLIIDSTEEAVKTFNVINEDSEEEEGRQKKVIGLFHLTC